MRCTRSLALLALTCSGLFGCAKSPTQPDSVVGLSIRSAQRVPLEGAPASGNELRVETLQVAFSLE